MSRLLSAERDRFLSRIGPFAIALIPFLQGGIVTSGTSVSAATLVEPAADIAWPRHTIDRTSRGADGVKLGDLDGDGRLDVVTGWEEGGEVRVYLNPGVTNVGDPWPRITVGPARDVEEAIFADLDGDGRLDVVSGTEGKTRTLFWHRFRGRPTELLNADRWTTVAFPATAGSQQWMQAAALQLDARHGLDLLLASKGTNAAIGWLQAPLNANDLPAWQYHRLRDAGWVMTLRPADLDGDGDPDVMFTDRKDARRGVFWLENPGVVANAAHASWPEHVIGATGREVMFADLGDIDGDGRPDVAAAVKPADIFVFYQRPGGRWQEVMLPLHRESIGTAKAVTIADVDGNGRADLVFSCEEAKGAREGVIWLEQRMGAAWRQHSVGGPEGVKFDLIPSVDLDGDGDLDFITTEEVDGLGVVWYENPHRSRGKE